MSVRSSPSEQPPDSKGVLFCPVCEHDSPVDGDWAVTEGDDGRRFECPDCSHVVVNQPQFSLLA